MARGVEWRFCLPYCLQPLTHEDELRRPEVTGHSERWPGKLNQGLRRVVFHVVKSLGNGGGAGATDSDFSNEGQKEKEREVNGWRGNSEPSDVELEP